MPLLGSHLCSSDSASTSQFFFSSNTLNGVLAVVFAPAAIYILAYGQPSSFGYIFAAVLVIRLVSKLDLFFSLKTSPLSGIGRGGRVKCETFTPAPRQSPAGRKSGSAQSFHTKHFPAITSRSIPFVAPTTIVSTDCPIRKTRRAILNKMSPDKLEELTVKLVGTFNSQGAKEALIIDTLDFVGLVFAATSRQPQYMTVFAELIYRVCHKVLPNNTVEEIIKEQAQVYWGSVCLTSVEKTKGWDQLSPDDQVDLKARHRAKQLSIAEFCGILASAELLQASSPLSWLEKIMFSVLTCSERSSGAPKGSSTEAALELICCGLRGLGPCEDQCLLTDIDQSRFQTLCDSVFNVPTKSPRVRCIIQDLKDLRESGWRALPSWKQALVPTKRRSSPVM